MQKLVEGIHHFQKNVFNSKRELFRKLADGQRPLALFITCSDARINPNLLTQTEPGEIFVLRNAGNLIPPAGTSGGEIATTEFAVKHLGIQDIIVCGHSDCGAMKAVVNPGTIGTDLPHMHEWLKNAQRTSDIIESEYRYIHRDDRLKVAVQENIVVQIENLRAHSFIEERVNDGILNIHGWVYKFETGEVFVYDFESGQYQKLCTEKQRQEELSQ